MDRKLVEEFRGKLESEKQNLLDRIARMNEYALDIPLQDSISELSSYDDHPADIGSEVFERSKDFALREGMELQVEQVDEALERIAAGVYGRCIICGREIPRERLAALPAADKCVECKEEEDVPDRHLRPIEEDVIVPPYGGFTHDSSPVELGDSEDEIEFDGEDAWQSVAYFGEHAENAGAGAYYGPLDLDEDIGYVEDVDHIPYEKGEDGMFYGNVLRNEEVDNWLTQDDVPLTKPGEQLDDQ